MDIGQRRITDILRAIGFTGALEEASGFAVHSAADGELLAQLSVDNTASLAPKVLQACNAQARFAALPWSERAKLVQAFAVSLKDHRHILAELITRDSGKTHHEALGEAEGSADIMLRTLREASLPELGAMQRRKQRPPVGVLGLITSFNFPLIVANWNIAPALLAGNAVVWKPSEKTPLAALAYKRVFDGIAGEHGDMLQLAIGGRELGEALVAHEQVDMVSATGSVAMGQGIKQTLARKANNSVPPILELGGNNGVILSERMTREHLEWSVQALLNSFFGTSGQRCTNTRRLIVHHAHYDQAVALFSQHIDALIASGEIRNPLPGESNPYGYGPLIDDDAYRRFERAKQQAVAEGGKVLFGRRLLADKYPDAYYVEPALALMPEHSAVMYTETFAPLLFITPYEGGIDSAVALVNAPANAGLVNGIYTLSQREADYFSAYNEAGHSVINSPKGTGTPAFGMGFGGNKASGEGEILNSADPLRPFTRPEPVHRIAQNKEIAMGE